MISSTPYQPKYSGSRALVVGINSYQYERPLAFAKNDAEAIAEVIEKDFAFPRSNITLIVDRQATRDTIREAFLEYRNTDRDERILFYFAGHGHTAIGNNKEVGYLVPVDGTSQKLASLLRWSDLLADADLVPAKHIFFVIDACFGGLIFSRNMSTTGRQRYRDDMLKRYARQALTAGKEDQLVSDGYGTRKGHSIFTSCLLDALDRTTQGAVDRKAASEISYYVSQNVGKDCKSNQSPHHGSIEGQGDFYFDAPDLSSETSVARAISRKGEQARHAQSPVVRPYKKHRE